MSRADAIAALAAAYDARDAAGDRAAANVEREFAGYIMRLQQELQDVMRREGGACLTQSGTTPSDTGE